MSRALEFTRPLFLAWLGVTLSGVVTLKILAVGLVTGLVTRDAGVARTEPP